jgi:carboxymethylenebutenolidase
MSHEQTTVHTQDGECPVHVFTPSSGSGPWPATIFYMDGLAIRPALYEMGQRLADAGYVVLLPDLFYRVGPYAPLDPKEIFASPEARAKLGPFFASTDNHKAAEDTKAFIDLIDSRDDVKGKKIGVTGYCMGGGMALRFAAARPDLIGAAASYHGGMLATDAPESPHHLLKHVSAELYFGHADKDELMDTAAIERFETALKESGKAYTSELYADAPHGFAVPGRDTYRADAAERHYETMLGLFDRALA